MDSSELFERINQGVSSERMYALSRNVRINKPLIDEHGGLSPVPGALRNRHCVVAGAGPSLERNLPHLLSISRRPDVVIICADMAFIPLVKAGIVPRYSISCETTPRDFFSGVDTSRTELLAFSGVCPRIAREWKGPIRFYNWMIHSPEYDELWKEAGLHLGFSATGSTVTTQAVSIAMGCGVKSLALAGNDLGFRDMFYLRGTLRGDEFLLASTRVSPLSAVQMSVCRRNRRYAIPRDRVYYTNHQFLAAKQWLEKLFAGGPFHVYDCCEPGCSGKNIVRIPLDTYVETVINGG
jgi:hypothetical protein